MSTDIGINRPAKTPPGTAPVAMRRGGHGDRRALARLRVKRRWLLRRCHDASFAPSSPPPAAVRADPFRALSQGDGANSTAQHLLRTIRARNVGGLTASLTAIAP